MICLQSLWSVARPGASRHAQHRLATATTPTEHYANRQRTAYVASRCYSMTSRLCQTSDARPRPGPVSESFRGVMRHVPHPVVVVTVLDCPSLVKRNGAGERSARVPDHWADADFPDSLSRGQETDNTSELGPLPRAMTASSFTSLTLHPAPTVLFNVTLPSRSHSAILASQTFNVHILSADQHGARIADLFARGYSSVSNGSTGGRADATQRQRRRLGMLADLEEIGVHIDGQQQWEAAWAAALRQKSSTHDAEAQDVPTPLLRGPGILHVLKCKLVHLQLLEGSESRNFALVAGEVISVISTPDASSSDQSSRNVEQATALSYFDGAYRGPSPAIMQHNTKAPPP
ncbi:flavin reductase [Microdochium nivale]|nr:flavin reductase [Microdochium nivale]